MLFQIVSDIHIEKIFPKKPCITDYIVPSADNLILAGDIGSAYYYEQLFDFFKSCKDAFETVIFVAGNNEYYLREGFEAKQMSELMKDMQKMCDETGVTLLDNSYIETESFIIFGSTWWSYIPDTLTMRIFLENDRKMNSDDFNHMHATARKCLNKLIETKGNKKLVVVSHYCPTKLGTMNGHHKKEDFTELVPYYFSSSEKFLRTGEVHTWIFGHTHVFRDFLFNLTRTRIVSNADPRKKFFRKNFTIEV